MFYVYILKSILNSQIYLGSTNNLKKRLKDHNDGKVISSKRYMPWSLVYYEAYLSEKLARIREKKLKYHGNSIRELKKRIGVLKNGAGFTLIEIIVVFTIIAILSLIGVAAFVGYGRSATLQNAASDISSTLLLAKSRAISQVKPPTSQVPQCNGQTVLNGYKVVFCPTSSSNIICDSNNSYVLGVVCSSTTCSDSLCSNITPQKIQSKPLPQNITFDSGSTATPFFFSVISGGVGGAPAKIILDGYGNQKIINVGSAGGIQIQ